MTGNVAKGILVAALALALLPAAARAQSGNAWAIDTAHANAQFVVRHLGISNVQGEFNKVTGSAQIDDTDLSRSTVKAEIDINSINTRDADRDKDLKSENFLDAAKFPAMQFVSKKFAKAGDGHWQLIGDLTLHGVTREVTFDVTSFTDPIKDPWGGTRRGFSAKAKINRQDFGVKWNGTLPTGELMVGNDVAITLDIELVKK